MIDLFHGTTLIVQSPLILEDNTRTDFGHGFYCTSSPQQAKERALEKFHASIAREAYVNEYEMSLPPADFKILRFVGPTEEWIDFVYNNRNKKGFKHNYDIVYGPVADNKLNQLFALYEDGIITKDQLRIQATNHNLKDQYLFHTKRSLEILKFKRAIKVAQIHNNKPKTKKGWTPKR